MSSPRNIVRAFLASPGDLVEERKAAKEVADNFNRMWANFFGYQVELLGWEDTVGQSGRPQQIINQELSTCELFIGLMYRRWGTPPDVENTYSSGFEEEFTLSQGRRVKTGEPEIRIFFKRVDQEFLRDPGLDLKRVLAFKDKLITEKSLLFEEFDETSEFRDCLSACLANYIQSLVARDREKEIEKTQKVEARPSTEPQRKAALNSKSLLSDETLDFARGFIDKLHRFDSTVTSLEVARFRLLANSAHNYRTSQTYLDVHDANIIFSNRHTLKLSLLEVSGLLDCSLFNFSSENVPLWHWLLQLTGPRPRLTLEAMLARTEAGRMGALSAMRLLRAEPTTPRDTFLKGVLGAEVASPVRAAALEYFADVGVTSDVPMIQEEAEKGNYATARKAIEAVLRIKLRSNYLDAFSYAMRVSFEAIRDDIVFALFERAAELNDDDLSLGLEHRCAKIRLGCVRALRARDSLDDHRARQLLEDEEGIVRYEALLSLIGRGAKVSFDEARKILVRPRRAPGLGAGLFGTVQRDDTGEKLYAVFCENEYNGYSKSDLERVLVEAPYNATAYLVYNRRFFEVTSSDVRKCVDDKFNEYFSSSLINLEQTLGARATELISDYRSLEPSIRKRLMRAGMTVLAQRGGREDLRRIRSHLHEKFADVNALDLAFMGTYGAWEDVESIAAATLTSISSLSSISLLSIPMPDPELVRGAAAAVYAIGSERIKELLALPLEAALLRELIGMCSEAKFSTLHNEVMVRLLSHEVDNVRRTAAIKCIRAMPKKRIANLLSSGIKYYNVRFWLDAGVSLPRARIKDFAKAARYRPD